MILFEKYGFKCEGTVFYGVKLWRSSLFTDGYMDGLIKTGNSKSKDEYIDCLDKLIKEEVHIKLSYSYMFEWFALLLLITLAIVIFSKIVILVLTIAFLTAVFYFFSWYMKRRATETYRLREVNKGLVELVFKESTL